MDEYIDLIGYEGLYKINKNGIIFGVKHNKERKNQIDRKGYYFVSLYKNNKEIKHSIHRLLALHFIPNYNINKTIVDHIDGNITNNKIDNLRWVTQPENMRNVISKTNYIYERIECRKDRGGSLFHYYKVEYPVYLEDGTRILKRKKSVDKNICEEFVEQMKLQYPNKYAEGRV